MVASCKFLVFFLLFLFFVHYFYLFMNLISTLLFCFPHFQLLLFLFILSPSFLSFFFSIFFVYLYLFIYFIYLFFICFFLFCEFLISFVPLRFVSKLSFFFSFNFTSVHSQLPFYSTSITHQPISTSINPQIQLFYSPQLFLNLIHPFINSTRSLIFSTHSLLTLSQQRTFRRRAHFGSKHLISPLLFAAS